MKESTIQIQICAELSELGLFYFSIPNERWGLPPAVLVQMKKMGLTPGMPDLCVLHDGKPYFLEVKTPNTKLSSKQIIIHKVLKENGFNVAIVRSVEEAMFFLHNWGLAHWRVI